MSFLKDGLTIWKQGNRYRWMATYSNKYRDEDLPPEIIAEAAHEKFIAEVDVGIHPYPVLLHWHIKNSRWGVADWLAYDKDTGFALASGIVDVGHEKDAEAMMAMEIPISVSHGMIEESIRRDDDDKSIITSYVTSEISDLPSHAAANKMTEFVIVKETRKMKISKKKRDYLRQLGYTEAEIEGMEDENSGKGFKFVDRILKGKNRRGKTIKDLILGA